MHTSDHHFVTLDLSSHLDVGEGTPDVFCASATTTVLAAHHEQVDLAVNQFGCGRAVYLAGLPYSSQNARLLHRALAWAGHREDAFTTWTSSDVRAEVAVYPHSDRLLVINNSLDQVTTTVSTPTTVREVHMEAAGTCGSTSNFIPRTSQAEPSKTQFSLRILTAGQQQGKSVRQPPHARLEAAT